MHYKQRTIAFGTVFVTAHYNLVGHSLAISDVVIPIHKTAAIGFAKQYIITVVLYCSVNGAVFIRFPIKLHAAFTPTTGKLCHLFARLYGRKTTYGVNLTNLSIKFNITAVFIKFNGCTVTLYNGCFIADAVIS